MLFLISHTHTHPLPLSHSWLIAVGVVGAVVVGVAVYFAYKRYTKN